MVNLELGQIFTPKSVAEYMANMFTLKDNASILDPCFGKGVFIDVLSKKNNYILQGVEIDKKLYDAYSNIDKDNCVLINADFLTYEFQNKFSGVIMNPPYIRHEKIDDLKDYGITKENLLKMGLFKKISKNSNLYMYFILKAIDLLDDNGELIVIFPNTWLKTKSGINFKDMICRECQISKQALIKGDVFTKDVLVDVVILKLIKTKDYLKTEEIILSYDGSSLSSLDCNNSRLVANKHINLKKVCKIKRGLTTGHNKLFVGEFSEDDNFLPYVHKILSSPKSIKGYSTNQAVLDDLLVISDNYNNLNSTVKKYINLHKESIIAEKKPKTLYESINKNDVNWYKIKNFKCKGIIFSYIIRESMKFILNDFDITVRDNFYVLYPDIDILLLFAILNNYYTYSRLEEIGKHYGGGLLKLQKYDLDNVEIIDINVLEVNDIDKLKDFARKLINTNDKRIIDEITMLLSKYESTTYEEIKEIYNNQCELRLLKGDINEL